MKKFNFLFVFIILSQILFAQDKLFSVEDVVFNSYTKLAPENIRGIAWIPGTDSYSFTKNEGETFSLAKSFVNSDKEETIVSLKDIAIALSSVEAEAPRAFPRFTWLNENEFYFWVGSKLVKFNISENKAEILNSIPENSANTELAPNNKFCAYTIDNNLYFRKSNDSAEIQITSETDPGIVCGQSVHRNEFGINGGIFWSPKSNAIAFYRMDETMVTDYPLVDLTTTPAKLNNIKYPMAGQTSHHVSLGVYNIESGKTVYMNTGEPLDHYLTAVTWDPSEKYVYIAILNRDQNHFKLTKFDAASGDVVKVLFEESDNEFVEPEHPLYFIPGNDNEFLWFSERDGFDHLYRYDNEGNLINQVTKGSFPVTELDGFSEDGKYVYFMANRENPTEFDYYKAEIETGEISRLTSGHGVHRITSDNKKDYFIDSFTSLEVPRIVSIIDNNGKELKEILKAENPLTDYKIGDSKILTLKADDGTDLYCNMITPPNFDPNKKYPVIVYVYGGPHVQLVTNFWGYGRYSIWFQYMAQHDYIVFIMDSRGSGNRGSKFEQATFRHLGTVEVKDQMVGVNYLKSLPYVDGDKFGVFGWSYGGFMTTSLMLRTNDAFKVGVAGGAVIDWKYYEVMYTERYMDTPQTNPEGYEEASLLNYVDNLNGRLLLVHGTNDPTVVWQNTLNFAKKAADLNKPLDYFPYPGHGHGVGGKDALHLYTKLSNYFFEYLK